MCDGLEREKQHTKVFYIDGQQVSCWLSRRQTGEMCIVVQIWIGENDIPANARITGSEDMVLDVFDGLSGETISDLLDDLGLTPLLRKLDK